MRATNGKAWGLAIVGVAVLLTDAERPSVAAAGPTVLHAARVSQSAAVPTIGQSPRRRPRRRLLPDHATKGDTGVTTAAARLGAKTATPTAGRGQGGGDGIIRVG